MKDDTTESGDAHSCDPAGNPAHFPSTVAPPADEDPTLATHEQELRRGTVVFASLVACRSPQYGYSLLSTLTEAGIPTEANTLYPLLRRLEKQGLLTAEWNTEQTRPRKYYTVTDKGAEVADRLHSHWLALNSSITTLWKEGTR
ncbi:DNA-binding PadR family transcriptional regulator [Brevibacterium sanguinis]|uniref:DNA-binding PadR family transcriptional regulator n=2 Tax=Brevibacterium TaxID=1696 RepID=A0A366IQG9_9MICO|nr:DNA-binding PadR family transcriptional regulator [Brevibacterium sanguinis]RBP74526.1 DNA-binding PadR family transcriptional regulator [Brevibacterium celere]